MTIVGIWFANTQLVVTIKVKITNRCYRGTEPAKMFRPIQDLPLTEILKVINSTRKNKV